MDLSLRDALGGGGVSGGAPAESLLKRDFAATLEKDSFDDKVGETVTKSDYRPLLDGKDTKSGPGMMSSKMSSGVHQDSPGQPAFSSDYLSGFSQSGMGGTMGSSLPPFQTSMSSTLGQSGMGSAMDTQKNSGLFGVENKTTSGSSSFKTSDLLSSGGPGIHSMDHSTAPVLSPSGSMDDSSPSSSTSDPLSPERVGPGGKAGKQQQRRKKKKRKDRGEVYAFLDSQENNIGQSDKHGMQDKGGWEAEEDVDEEENREWEIRESGGGGRVKSRKTKSRARLPEEWGAPQQPISPTLATVAPTWTATVDSGPFDSRAPNSSPSPVLPSAPAQIPTSFTNSLHASPVTDSSPRSYEPMCVDDFLMSAKGGQKANEDKVSTSNPEPNVSLVASAANKSSLAGDVSSSLALMAGDNLSPVSQTFSFLDSVLQTPPGSTPDSQTTTPIINTPSLATALLSNSTPTETSIPASQASSVFSPSKSTIDFPPTSALSTNPSPLAAADPHPPTSAVGSSLNVDAQPFVPSATLISSTAISVKTSSTPVTAAAAYTATTATVSTTTSDTALKSSASPRRNEASPTSGTPPQNVVTPFSSVTTTLPSSITPAAPPSLPAHSEHQESSSSQLPPLEVKSDNKDKQEKKDIMSSKTDKIDTFDKKEKEEQQKKDNGPDKNQKSEKIVKDEEKIEKMNVEKNNKAMEKAEKVDKPEKTNKDEKKEEEKKPAEKKEESGKGVKGTAKSPTGNSSKTLPSPDSKSKPDVASAKPNSAKSRPSTLSTNGEANSAKRPIPTTASTNKKSPVPKATTPTAVKQSPMAVGFAKAAKTPENGTAEKRPPVPKATATPRATANKNSSSATAASKTAANKNDKTENKTGEAKKPKSTARPRPASTTTPATPAASTNGENTSAHRRRVITKPPVPKQTPLEKKPPVPRAPRTPRPINAPTPDLKNIRSKIGSIDNIKYQPGGGKVSSTPNNKTSDPSTPAAKTRVQIVHKKLDFSHVTSRCGSKDNIKHVPGGGNVQILNKKVDLSKVTSKCGSKDNIKHKPGGGDVKIESHKLNIKAKSKIGSLDNVGPGNGQTNGHKEEKTEEKTSSPPSGAPTTGPAGVAKATAPGGTKENGVKDPTPTPFGGDGLREPLSIDKRITETN
ncbi:microtubule-associated protein 4 isoform X2 [Micropterus salmoides]|uniref:microtubule-associated protein 4 isoform X2 n=1 Tax=Micropterus salmoides TaxID=27706 RepID=UPI0018EDA5A8|nr:microtubule-associated protein 4 isoform X2 [Micropterus salmoides]